MYALCVVLAWAALAWRQAGARGARWTVKRPRYPSSGHRLVRQPDVTIDGHVFLLTQCARACWTHARCRSYNFNARRRRCEMNHVTHVEVPSLLRPLAGYTYHTRATLSLDKVQDLVRRRTIDRLLLNTESVSYDDRPTKTCELRHYNSHVLFTRFRW